MLCRTYDQACFFLRLPDAAFLYRFPLFEPAAGRLRFAFIQSDTFEGTKNEERYYYDDCGKLATVNIKGERTVDDTSLVSNAETLRTLVPKYLDFSY